MPIVTAPYASAGLARLGVGLATRFDPGWPYPPLGYAVVVGGALVGVFLAQQVRALRRYRDARALDVFNVNMVLGPLVLAATVLGLAWR